jgi:hypothetical protein
MSVLGESHLTTEQAAQCLGVSVRSLETWRTNRLTGAPGLPQGPAFIRIGRRVYYLRSELQRYERVGEQLVASVDQDQEDEDGIARAPLLPLPPRVPMPR